MNIYDNVKIAARVITVPERIEYPQIRFSVEPGTIQAGDVVALTLAVHDSKGTEKYSTGEKIQLKEFPTDKEIGIAAIAKLTLTEQPTIKPEIIVGAEEIIKER